MAAFTSFVTRAPQYVLEPVCGEALGGAGLLEYPLQPVEPAVRCESQQVALGWDMVVDGGLGDTQGARQDTHRCRFEAALVENIHGYLEDGLPVLPRASAGFGRGRLGRGWLRYRGYLRTYRSLGSWLRRS